MLIELNLQQMLSTNSVQFNMCDNEIQLNVCEKLFVETSLKLICFHT